MYDPSNLTRLNYANGWTLWHYTTPDSLAAVVAPSYFDLAADFVRKGDFIEFTAQTRGAIVGGRLFATTGGPSPRVRVTPMQSSVPAPTLTDAEA